MAASKHVPHAPPEAAHRAPPEAELQEQQEKYQTLFENMAQGVFYQRADGTVVDVNRAALDMLGLTRDEFLRRTSHDSRWRVVDETGRELAGPQHPSMVAMRTGQAIRDAVLGVMHPRTNQFMWLSVNAIPQFRPGERDPYQVFVTLHDVTQHRRSEEALRQSEARLRGLFEQSMLGILLTSPDGRIYAANPAACRLIGRSEEEICRIGRTGIVDQSDPRVGAYLKERKEKGSVVAEMFLVRADGTRVLTEVASAVFDSPEGPRTCMILQDISQRRKAEERIHDLSRQLLSAQEEEKRRVSAVLHHDVGSISVGITARLDAAEDDVRAGRNAEAMASLRQCRELFAQSMARLKQLAMDLRPPDLDILGLSAALRQHVRRLRQETSLRIRFVDRTRRTEFSAEIQICLFRVVQECLNNVAKHAEAQSVQVRLSRRNHRVDLRVSDDGRGFSPERVERATGVCLGLRAMREMLGALGGELVIDSSLGAGTTVLATIPLGRSHP